MNKGDIFKMVLVSEDSKYFVFTLPDNITLPGDAKYITLYFFNWGEENG